MMNDDFEKKRKELDIILDKIKDETDSNKVSSLLEQAKEITQTIIEGLSVSD